MPAIKEISFKPKKPRRKQFNFSLPENLHIEFKEIKAKAGSLGMDFNDFWDQEMEAALERAQSKLDAIGATQSNGNLSTIGGSHT